MRTIALPVLSVVLMPLHAQLDERALRMDLRFGDHALVLDSDEQTAHGAVRITELKFYVGHLTALHEGEVVWSDNTYHLIDASDPASQMIELPTEEAIDVISFTLGVDSLTNVSGAFGGDLDPTKGMYWTWNSGYINFKLEGNCSARATREGQFQFHLGGYLPPHVCAQQVTLPVRGGGPIDVRMDIARFFQPIDAGTEPNVMSPGERAVFLSQVAAQMFNVHENRP